MSYTTDTKHVTTIHRPVVVFDGTAECSVCGRPISYRTDTHPIPTLCKTCGPEFGDNLCPAGDGFIEPPAGKR